VAVVRARSIFKISSWKSGNKNTKMKGRIIILFIDNQLIKFTFRQQIQEVKSLFIETIHISHNKKENNIINHQLPVYKKHLK